MLRSIVLLVLISSLALGACAPAATTVGETEGVSGTLVIYSGRSEPLIQPVIDAFRAQYPNVEVLLKSGSNSQMANALLEEQANSQADLFITTEIFTIQTLASQGLFQPYRPANAALLPADALGADDLWVGVTRRTRVIMYNTALVSPEEAPKSLMDLTDPKWKGQIAAAGSTNGSMQAQIAVMQSALGVAETENWLQGLVANDVTFFGGHTDVRKAVGAGEFKLGLVNHYYYYLQAAEGSPVGMVVPDQQAGGLGLISNLTAAGITAGAKNPQAAQAFVDFLLSAEGQKLFADANYEYPVLAGVATHPDVKSLDAFTMTDVNLVLATNNLDAVFNSIDKVGLP
jgi:iron(III) transport system substrate-binding protein